MSEIWRVLDTGLRAPAQNIALDRALLEARQADEIPSTLRFLRFTRCALLGHQQSAEHEFNADYCSKPDCAIQRRITGGPALYVDDAQLSWSLYLHNRDVDISDMRAVSRRIRHAVATAVSALGVDARQRHRDDIEVDGRTIGSCGFASDAHAALFAGAIYIDLNIDEMMRALRTPAGTLDQAQAAAAERVTDLKRVLGRQPEARVIKRNIVEALESDFDVELREADVTLTEDARYRAALPEIDTPGWVNLVSRPMSEAPIVESHCASMRLRAALIYDKVSQVVRQVWFTGDIAANPHRAIADLEAELRDVPIDRIARNIERFFASRPVVMPTLTPNDFVDVVTRALQQRLLAQNP